MGYLNLPIYLAIGYISGHVLHCFSYGSNGKQGIDLLQNNMLQMRIQLILLPGPTPKVVTLPTKGKGTVGWDNFESENTPLFWVKLLYVP